MQGSLDGHYAKAYLWSELVILKYVLVMDKMMIGLTMKLNFQNVIFLENFRIEYSFEIEYPRF